MTHLEMGRFRNWLETVNAMRLSIELPIIESFFPGDFIKGPSRVKKDLPNREENNNDTATETYLFFKDMVFLRATKRDLDKFVYDKLNTDFRIKLMYYLTPTGEPATIPTAVMQEFIEVCLKYRGRFELCPPIEGIEKMDKVEITSGPFAGREASVLEVRHAKGKLHLKLAVELISGIINIEMKDVSRQQIVILDRKDTDFIRTDFIKYTQNHLLPILYRRMKRVNDEDSNRRDAAMLIRLYHYRHHKIEGGSARLHFLSLMLICAHLYHDKAGEAQLQEEALQALAALNEKGEASANTDTRTYLWIALYIATGEVFYRNAAKRYVQECQPKSDKLRKFVSIIRSSKKI